jgi:uncharacterized protein (DUF433 family)
MCGGKIVDQSRFVFKFCFLAVTEYLVYSPNDRGCIVTKPSAISADPRYQPLYTIAEVARFARANRSTLRTWVVGRTHPYKPKEHYPPVLKAADQSRQDMLSFMNLIETHVLIALRTIHRVPLHKVRAAVDWLRRETGLSHPFAELAIETDGRDLFARFLGRLFSASERGQAVMPELVERFLRRVKRDAQGLPELFFPFTRSEVGSECPMDIVINPAVVFGRPVIFGTRISTAVIFERYTAGESIIDIATDYNVDPRPVEEALRCEIEKRAA